MDYSYGLKIILNLKTGEKVGIEDQIARNKPPLVAMIIFDRCLKDFLKRIRSGKKSHK